jgi:tRNA (guanine37-N1)-methyltransferase
MGEYRLTRRLKERLSGILPSEVVEYVYNSYDVIGNIAIIRLNKESQKYCNAVAEAIIDVHKNTKTVLAQTSAVHGDFRLRKLSYVAGENKTTTVHKESACLFKVDVKNCYFSSRLHYERMRIANQVATDEVIVNMFAGVGCFSILIAKHLNVQKVYSIDVNPAAVQYMRENIRVNGVYGKVIPILGDAKSVIEDGLCHVADRILMPLPEKAFEYLPYALLALKPSSGWIHYYDFEYAKRNEDPTLKVKLKVTDRLKGLGVAFSIPFCRVVRSTGPHWYQVVLDIEKQAENNSCENVL